MKIYNVIRTGILLAAGGLIITMLALYLIFNIYPVVIVSGSMEPELPTGSLCFVDHDERENIKEGDIIAFKKSDITVTHRVIDVTDKGQYITKGDANAAADFSPAEPAQILGTVAFNIPWLGYLIMAVKSPKGIVILCLLCIALIIVNFVYDNIKLKF